MLVLDQVAPGPDHDVAVGLERLLERRRVVALDAVDDGRPRRRPDRSRGPPRHAPRGSAGAAPRRSPGSRRVEAVERPEADELVVALAPERPVVGAVGQRSFEPGRGTPRARPARRRSAVVSRRRSASGRIHRPRPRSRRGTTAGRRPTRSRAAARAGPGGRSPGVLDCSRYAGHGLEAAGDRVEPLGERREVLGEDQEEAVADRRRAPSSGAPRSGRPRCRRSRAAGCGSRGRARSGPSADSPAGVDRLDVREVGLLLGQLVQDARRASRRRAGRPRCGCRRTCRRWGCRGRSAGSAPRRGRRAARRAGPGRPVVGRVRTTSSSRSVTVSPMSLLRWFSDALAAVPRPRRR